MEYSESILCGAGELELDPDIVSEEAGKLYSELQAVVETHGAGVVESLVPILVWVLEGLADSRAKLREREDEAERERGERERLLERYQAEKALRRECQEKYLELDDQIEQDRRALRAREKERERRERELEKKARGQADQLVALEDQKASLGRELSTLRLNHNKLTLTYRELQERKKDSERESPLRNSAHPKSSELPSSHILSESIVNDKTIIKSELHSDSTFLEEPAAKGANAIDIAGKSSTDPSFINDIISSTPELSQFHSLFDARTPDKSSLSEPSGDRSKTSLEEELKEASVKGAEKKPVREDGRDREKRDREDENHHDDDDDDDDSMEWELRNTDSLFSELSELSRDYVESVDHGASVRGSTDQFEEILSQHEELKRTHELVDAARKALISRVEELTNDRSALKLELASFRESVSRLENRLKEMEQETKRLRKDLEACQSEDPDASLPTSMRRFSRSEMARVVMEKNQYKERLFELQEAVRRNETFRATKDEKITEEKRTSVWRRFNKFIGLAKDPLIPHRAPGFPRPTSPALGRSPSGSPLLRAVGQTHTESVSPAALSPRVRRRELYREIRSHIWESLGKRQINGWSMPLSHTQESLEPTPEPKDVPVLVQLRLLDQRVSTAKLNCAIAVTPEISGEPACSVWVVSGLGSSSDITVIDPARSNTVLDQFSLPPTSPALCICAVPPMGDTTGTVWIGTQEGSVLVHPASAGKRRCMQSISLSEGIHSLTYSKDQVIAGLANGALAFFSCNSGGWDLPSHRVMSLGSSPLQPIRCCLAKAGRLWVGYWNRVHVVDTESLKVEQTISVSERSEQQVRFLCAGGSGVWASCRLDPVLRLFDWSTGRPLQQLDMTPLVTKALGQAFLALSSLQISTLTIISSRLWVGMGSGAIFSIPLSITSESVSIPYCSLAAAQLCYHGHRQAVKFIIIAPDCLNTSTGGSNVTSQLILSGGEGYINFRIGDDASDGSPDSPQTPQRSERSHMIIWQSPTPPLPSSML